MIDVLTRRALLARLDKSTHGYLRLTTPEGRAHDFGGAHPRPQAAITLHDWAAARDWAARGDIGFADTYRAGRWDTPDLEAVAAFFLANDAALGGAVTGRWLARAGSILAHALRPILGLSVQKLAHHAAEQTPEAVERFVNQTFPKLQRFAKVIGADIAFEDEAGVDLHEYSGKTWGLRGVSLKVIVTGRREHLNILSTVSARGESRDHVTDGRINCDVYIDFLKQVLKGCTRPLIIVVGGASFHRSRKVRVFIAQHRHRMRLECLPAYSPERHPNEHAWEEIKDNKLARQVIANKHALNQHVHSALGSLQKRTSRILSFFQLPETKYAAAC